GCFPSARLKRSIGFARQPELENFPERRQLFDVCPLDDLLDGLFLNALAYSPIRSYTGAGKIIDAVDDGFVDFQDASMNCNRTRAGVLKIEGALKTSGGELFDK